MLDPTPILVAGATLIALFLIGALISSASSKAAEAKGVAGFAILVLVAVALGAVIVLAGELA